MNKNVQLLRELSNLAILFDDLSYRMSKRQFEHFVATHKRLERVNGIQLIEVRSVE